METREQTIDKILYDINMSWVVSKSKTDLLTPQHTKFDCLISYKDNEYAFTYQCNINYTKPDKLSLLSCLFSDSRCYEYCKETDDDTDNMQNFAREFGYDTDNLKGLFKAYKDCKDTYNALKKMFTDEERQLIYEYLEEKEMF